MYIYIYIYILHGYTAEDPEDFAELLVANYAAGKSSAASVPWLHGSQNLLGLNVHRVLIEPRFK